MSRLTFKSLPVFFLDFPCGKVVKKKNLPAMQEIWVQSQGWEVPLEEGIATHPSILVWRIPRTEEPGEPQAIWVAELDMTEVTSHARTRYVRRF